MGMITLTDNLQTSMQQFAHNLTALHREISSESMQGRTNFLVKQIFVNLFSKKILYYPEFEIYRL